MARDTPTPAWSETYEGGSAEAERLAFEDLAQQIMQLQQTIKRRAGAGALQRTFHAKPVFSALNAELAFADDLPAQFQAGFAQPGRRYPAIVRFSNANGHGQADGKPDLRGLAVRIAVEGAAGHDLLGSNYHVSHARDARQFVAAGKLAAKGPVGRMFGIAGLALQFGPAEAWRMIANIARSRRPSQSLALETYWSRGAMRWGETLAVRYRFRPAPEATPALAGAESGPDFLSKDFQLRLAEGPVRFDLCLQTYVDPATTPIENAAAAWDDQAAPPVKVATLTITRAASNSSQALADEGAVETLAFNPWNTTDEFRPLGNINRARKVAYDASSAQRLGYRWLAIVPLRNRIASSAVVGVFGFVNRFIEWHKLPLHLSLINLDAFRIELRKKNLIDTEVREAPPTARSAPAPPPEETHRLRRADGRFTDQSAPEMGAAGATFGRNMPPILQPELFDTPSPIRISRELLQRKAFIPARSLNILAAAWIQFQVHDWVNHPRHPVGKDDVVVPLPEGMTWQSTVGGPEERVMRIGGNADPIAPGPGRPPIYFRNTETHWWDTSDLYGSSGPLGRSLREGPKIRLVDGYLPPEVNGPEVTGFNQSWWMGLSVMHLLFAREHNLLCDELQARYRHWDDERVYQTARLIVSALVAKIHTIEWTPAILGTRALEIAMNTNWSGPPNDWVIKGGLWLLDESTLTGIPKSKPNHNGVPYSLTEEFIATYRLHPLIPDDYSFFDGVSGAKLVDHVFHDIQGSNTDEALRSIGLANALYSFGKAYPGAITLHNFPHGLMKFEREGEFVDLSVVDLVRTRRRGVPRYNDFRAGLHKSRIRRWEDLATDPEDVRLLKDIYKDIDHVDTMVGMFAETPPAGFGFSDTAFRIFILMASRRIQSDRFLTVDFRPEIYSDFGMDWIANNGLKSVIQRHCPELAALLPDGASAFAPWRTITPA